MTTTEHKMKSVSPNIFVNDIKKTIEFYLTIGFKVVDKTFYGATEFSIVDINNYMITFAEDERNAEHTFAYAS